MQVFQVVPPVVRDIGNGFEIDRDFYGSLSIYMETFESFALACPVRTSNVENTGLDRCVTMKEIPWGPDRFKFIPLPMAYKPTDFVRELPRIKKWLRSEIEDADHLIFSPYSLVGDWPTIAIREAVKMGRRYTIEADGVHGDIMRKRHISNSAWKRWVKRTVEFPAFDASYRYCLSRSSLAIFQGQDVYNAYAEYCPNPQKLNHHLPIYAGDHISDTQLQRKLANIRNGGPLNIRYAGRAIDMKGPADWIQILSEAARSGVRFDAAWLGDGPMLGDMRAEVSAHQIPGVRLDGPITIRDELLDELKAAHIFLFCHKTLESARILGEALACGAPLVGYGSAYPADLVGMHGGGLFSEVGDVASVVQNIQELDRDRNRLAQLVEAAARSGKDIDRDVALRRRVELVKQQSRRHDELAGS